MATYCSVSKPCTPVVHIKIAGKWMFIPLKMVLIGIDPYPYCNHGFFQDIHSPRLPRARSASGILVDRSIGRGSVEPRTPPHSSTTQASPTKTEASQVMPHLETVTKRLKITTSNTDSSHEASKSHQVSNFKKIIFSKHLPILVIKNATDSRLDAKARPFNHQLCDDLAHQGHHMRPDLAPSATHKNGCGWCPGGLVKPQKWLVNGCDFLMKILTHPHFIHMSIRKKTWLFLKSQFVCDETSSLLQS